MYDPEKNLWFEEQFQKVKACTERIREITHEGHPMLELCEAFDNVLDYLNQLRNDYDNCFDEDERAKLGKEIRDGMEQLCQEWSKVEKLYS
jgi:DUF438 domain-containing protein